MRFEQRLLRLWYGPAWRSLPLWPLAWLFGGVVSLRRLLYRTGALRARAAPVPVVVVGNLTVGGTGKTPITAWLASELGRRGHRVGVVLRGYGGSHSGRPRIVAKSDDPAVVGDEALLHARRGAHVVVVGADRVAAATLAAEHGAEIIVCDDGLQHLRLAREFEIAVVDAARGLGNGWMLPAGPLREPARRLEHVDAVLLTERGGEEGVAEPVRPRAPLLTRARLRLGEAVNLLTAERRALAAFAGAPVHAVAAIGHPQAFFAGLRRLGLEVVEHPLADHATLDPVVLAFPADATVLMTEKDAVKCHRYAQPGWWWVDLEVSIDRSSAEQLLTLILERAGLSGAGVRLG